MDLTESLVPKSDQLDAIELVPGPRTFTIEGVTESGKPEQPFNFHLAGFPRVWRPGKSMRRVIAAAWGPLAEKYAGQRVTLFCDQSVQFGSDTVGGTRISHMSGIDKPLKVPLLIKRGKSAMFTVQPLPDAPTAPPADDTPAEVVADWVAAFNDAADIAALQELWKQAGAQGVAKNAEILAAKDKRKGELTRD